MPGHGAVINARRYYVYTGPDGKQVVSDTAPAGGNTGVFGTGIGATPNPAATEYEERTYADGTKILSRFDEGKGEWVQQSVEVDPGIRGQHKDDQAAATKEGPKPQPTRTLPDGTMEEFQPDGTWKVIGTKPQGPAAPDTDAPTVRTMPDGSQTQWNPATRKWEPFADAKPEGGNLPGLNLPPTRAGQRTDLSGIKAQHDAYVSSLNADKALTPQERASRYQTYMQTVVQPQLDRATAEANAEADRQIKRQQEQDAAAARSAQLAESRETRAGRQEDRLTAAEERRAKLDEEKLTYERDRDAQDRSYRSGRDAVSDALALMKYRVDPSFSPSLAGIYNGILGGQGSFQPGAFQFDLPDTDAIAASHVDGLLGMHANTAAPRAAAAAPAPPIAPAQTAATVDPLAGVPVAPRVPDPNDPNRDRWYNR